MAEDNTTAQKPDNAGTGSPPSPSVPDAERDQENPIVGAQPPSEAAAEIREPSQIAAGLPAMYQTARFAVREMGVVRGFKTLLNANKKSA